MYLNYFRLSREPFHVSTSLGGFYMSEQHREALAMMIYGVQKKLGFLALTGEVGTGKTTVLRAYLEKVRGTQIQPIMLFNPEVSFERLLLYILRGLGVDARGRNERWMLQTLMLRLQEERNAGRTVVVVIDEAHHMPVDTLARLHLISNMEGADGKLLQAIFVGQPELDELLSHNRLRQIRQRIAVRLRLGPLSNTESIEYIKFRIDQAGRRPKDVMTKGAIRTLARASGGVPRLINVYGDNALIAAMGHDVQPVSSRIVRGAVRDYNNGQGKPVWRWAISGGLAAVAIVVAVGSILWVNTRADAAMANSPEASVEDDSVAAEPKLVRSENKQ